MFKLPIIIAGITAICAVLGGAVALFNTRKAVLWKRAELANSYMRELRADQELVFVCRALEWNGGRLVVPEGLRPLLSDGRSTIDHEPSVMRTSTVPGLLLEQVIADDRLDIYRTSIDRMLSWLSLICSAIDRNLFLPQDVSDVGYWIIHIEKVGFLEEFIDAFGYREDQEKLRRYFDFKRGGYSDGRALDLPEG